MYESKLLALLATRDVFVKAQPALASMPLTKETTAIIQDISLYYKDFPALDKVDWEDFLTWSFAHRHPLWTTAKRGLRTAIINNVRLELPDSTVLERLLQVGVAEIIEKIAVDLRANNPTSSIDDLELVAEDYRKLCSSSDNFFVDMNVDKLVTSVIKGDGIEWRLTDLNLSVGQLHKSDFIIVGKRPETGGTTFLTSEFTHMLSQLPEGKCAIIFNNEEGGEKVGLRLVQSALGLTSTKIASNPLQVQQDYTKFLNGKQIYVYDNTSMTTRDVEGVLAEHPECYLIGINILDKITFPVSRSENEVARLRELSWWGRKLANKHGVVFAVAQADAEAEGQKYLLQTQLYGSKTGMQGEADVQIMIGRDPDQDSVRYFSVVKNKKVVTGSMIPTHRHAKFPAKFDVEIGRFLSLGELK